MQRCFLHLGKLTFIKMCFSIRRKVTYFFNQMLRLERKMKLSILSPEQFGVKHETEKKKTGKLLSSHYDKEEKGAKIECTPQRLASMLPYAYLI